jgi:branched-chain amino acid transport system ATP-binding protein
MVGASARRVVAREGDNQLVVEGVSKRFGGVTAVQDVSLDVPTGSILSIIGPNGAGKTSLLNMISGFYKPDSGRILLEGRDITQRKPSDIAALGIARTFQNIALFSGLTVLDNLMLGRHVRMKAGVLASVVYWGMAQKEDIAHRAAVEEIIEFLKLQDLRKLPTAALAYGLRKRVELGRALAVEPKVLLLDEPTSALDPISTAKIEELISELKTDYTIAIVTHNMQQAARVSDYTAYMYLGELIEFGATDELFLKPSRKETEDYITGRFG